jgi:TPP-dependent pyruvate/acetoin dehydrogenase alpha subunit
MTTLRTMLRIRRFEERLIGFNQSGQIAGHFHVYVGQEATATAVAASLGPDDVIYTTHRNHGHLLARGADPHRMFAEILGRSTGYCGGLAGSIHLAAPDLGIPVTSGSVGGNIPQAVGAALALSRLSPGTIAVCFFGDGTFEEGAIFEALNTASLWKLPLLLVCENNGLDEPAAPGAFPTSATAAERLASIPEAFGIPSFAVDGSSTLAQNELVSSLVAEIRGGGGPRFIEASTVRWPGNRPMYPTLFGGPLDVGWLTGDVAPPDEIAEWTLQSDPLGVLVRESAISSSELRAADAEITAELERAAEQALGDDWPTTDVVFAGFAPRNRATA